MALITKSGIKYTTGDNGAINGVQYANKIVTINDGDYFLLDAHSLDWNKSELTHIQGKATNTTLDTIRNNFFELSDTDEHNNKVEEPFNRRRYFKNGELPSYTNDGKMIKMPNWFDGEHPNHIYDSAELLDVIDYLACLAHSAIEEIDGLKNQLDKDKAVLVFNEKEIEDLGGKVDSSGNVSAYPIQFELKPNQSNKDYVSTQTIKRFYDSVESRSLGFTLYVYTVSNEPITDEEILYKAGFDPTTGKRISGLLWTFTEAQIATDTTVASQIEVGTLSNYSTGCFKVNFEVKGWDPQFKPKTIHLNKTQTFEEPSKSDMWDYSNDDTKSIDFTAMTQTTNEHRQSDPRKLNFILKKSFNAFDRVFICGEEYIYLDETFFNGYENDSTFKTYVYGESAEMSTLKYRLTYLLRKSLLPVALDKLTPRSLADANLLPSLILVTNEFLNPEMLIKGVNVTNSSEIVVEVYPKYYGLKNKIISENRRLPGSYEEIDTEDGKGHNSYEDKNIMYNLNNCMAPLYCIDYPHSSTKHKLNSSDKNTTNLFTYPTNEKSNNVNVCDYCEREIDGTLRSGYKFSFKMTCSEPKVMQAIIEYNRTHIDKIGYLDIIFGTTATRYVASSFIKIRFYLASSSDVYFIDMTKDYDSSNKWNDRNNLENQWQQNKKITTVLSNRYGLNDNPPYTSLLFKESNIKKNASGEYEWDLTLPILSYWSWTPNNATVGDTSYNLIDIYNNVISPQMRNYETVSQTSPQNILADPSGPQKRPVGFENAPLYNKYKYSYGFPSIPIGTTESNYTNIEKLLLIKAICINYDTIRNEEGRRDISSELEIDYATTYKLSTAFINTLSEDIKAGISGPSATNMSDEDKGKHICSYFCGFEVRNDIKYFTMIHPTISSKCFKPFYSGNSILEWEEEISRSESIYRNCKLKVVFRIPEVVASVQNGVSVNHGEGKLILNLNVQRANNNFAGWASRRDRQDQGVAAATAINCGQPINKRSFIGSTGFGSNNVFNKQTRNDGNYYIFNGIANNVPNALQVNGNYSPISIREFMLRDEQVHCFNCELTNGELVTIYCKQNGNEFTLYRTQNFNPKEVTDADIQYRVDNVIPFNMQYIIDGNEWFRGYTPNSTTRLSQDVFLYNKQNNYIKMISKASSSNTPLYDLGSESNKDWYGGLIQAFTTVTIANIGTLESGNYLTLEKEISYDDLLNDLNDWSLSFLSFGDGRLITLNNEASTVTNLTEFYGEDWQKYVKFSMTAGIKFNTETAKFPTLFEDIMNVVPTENSINLYIRKITGTTNWELYREYGYNMFYESGEVVNDIDDYFNVNAEFDTITMKDKLKDYIRNKGTGGFVLGMNVCIMFPMTHIYRGKFFIAKMKLKVV